MKKVFYLSLVMMFGLALSGCWLSPSKNDDQVMDEPMAVSEDDSVAVIEEELNDTELQEFETELDSMDEEINQL